MAKDGEKKDRKKSAAGATGHASSSASADTKKGKKRSRSEKISATKGNSKAGSSKDAISKKKGGLDEIDDIFAAKKSADKAQRIQDEKDEKERKRRRRERREEAAAPALGQGGGPGGSSSSFTSAPSHLRGKAKTKSNLSYTRDDAAALNSGEWANDGLGGIFDGEGYTGRKSDSGMKIYKAHLFNKKGFGTTKDCPFDCDCCYI